MFWIFFAIWFGIFATIALIIVVNYRGFGRSSPELNHKEIGRGEFDEEAERERAYMRRQRRESGIVWTILLWAAFLATVCVAALNQQAAIVHLMHEAWKTFLVTFHH